MSGRGISKRGRESVRESVRENHALKQRMSGRGNSKRGRESIRESIRENYSRISFICTSMHAWDWLLDFLFGPSL
jgi:hypothetical protein